MKRLSLIKESISSPPLSLQHLQTLKINIQDGVGSIWFDKGASFNSISFRMAQQFNLILQYLDKNSQVKIIVIRSKHSKAFCVGADIKSIFFDEEAKKESSMFIFLQRTFRSIRKPIISLVQGLALGGGFQIALLSDIILCSDKATFGLPEISLGIFPGLGGTQHLPRIVGSKVAMRRILTGLPMTAAQAHDLNIVECFPADKFDQKSKEFIETLLNRPSQAISAAKEAIQSAMETTLEQGLKFETSLFQGLFNKKSSKEGLSAFVEKRKPDFRNI